MQGIDSLRDKLQGIRALVVGDVMLDRYLIGDACRISPEAPVPVVNLIRERLVAGGAANVAANISGLGVSVNLLSVVGNDDESELLAGLLEENGIDRHGLIKSETRVTTVKNRIMAQGQQLVRLDSETVLELNDSDTLNLVEKLESSIEGCDVLVISDYGKGVISGNLIPRLISKAKTLSVPVVVDPKGSDYYKYSGAAILTPNRQEAEEFYFAETRKTAPVEEIGKFIREKLDIKDLVITLGADGMAVFSGIDRFTQINASARNVFDVTGAGDTVIAVISSCVATGMALETACQFANTAAGLVVEQVGTTAINFEVLMDGFDFDIPVGKGTG